MPLLPDPSGHKSKVFLNHNITQKCRSEEVKNLTNLTNPPLNARELVVTSNDNH